MAEDADRSYNIAAKITADTAGADKLKGALAGVTGAAGDTAESTGEVADKVGNAGEGFEETSHQAMEAAHALHGAEFAFRGVEDAARTGNISVISLVDSLRGLAMASGAGLIFGGIATAITVAISAFDYFRERTNAAADAQKKLNDSLADAQTDMAALATAEQALSEPAETWKEKLEGARDALKETLDLMEAGSNSRIRLLQAQEKLDLAKLEGSGESPEQQAADKVGIEKKYSGLIAGEKESALTGQQSTQEQEIDSEREALARAQREAANAKMDADRASQRENAQADQIAKAKKKLEEIQADMATPRKGESAGAAMGRLMADQDTIKEIQAFISQVEATMAATTKPQLAAAKAKYEAAQNAANDQQTHYDKVEAENRTAIAKEQIEKETIAGEQGDEQQTYTVEGAIAVQKAQKEAAEMQAEGARKAAEEKAKQEREAQEAARRATEEAAREANSPQGRQAANDLDAVGAIGSPLEGASALNEQLAKAQAAVAAAERNGTKDQIVDALEKMASIAESMAAVASDIGPEKGRVNDAQRRISRAEQDIRQLRSWIANTRPGTT